jgi:hypothetical protein
MEDGKKTMRRPGILIGVLALVAACRTEPAKAQSEYVDSAIPIEEALRGFRTGLPRPAGLEEGYPSREKLVREFVRALEGRDTAAFRKMVLNPGEFAWLYYPSSPLSRPPYELSPGLMWFQLQGESEKGASRLLAERAGQPLGYLRHECGSPRTQGELHIYPNCALHRVIPPADTLAERLFGLVVEREGEYKFLGYANMLE